VPGGTSYLFSLASKTRDMAREILENSNAAAESVAIQVTLLFAWVD
jgi:hypothetical protein